MRPGGRGFLHRFRRACADPGTPRNEPRPRPTCSVKTERRSRAGRSCHWLGDLDVERVTEQTYYRRKAKHGGVEFSEIQRLTALEDENRRLKQIVAEQMEKTSPSFGVLPRRPFERQFRGNTGVGNRGLACTLPNTAETAPDQKPPVFMRVTARFDRPWTPLESDRIGPGVSRASSMLFSVPPQ